MRIAVGCDLQEFERYCRKLAQDKEWQGTFGFTEELDTRWERVLVENPSLLLVWRENDETRGHVIWHETSTDEHRAENPRDREDREILRRLCGGKTGNVVELHEIWLRKTHRGKGYGEKFFEFLEAFIRRQGYAAVIYYADHPAAITICQKRGWKEGFLAKEKWYVFCFSLSTE